MPDTSGRWTNGYANIPVDFKFHSCTLKWLELKLHFLGPLISIPRKHASTELSHSIASEPIQKVGTRVILFIQMLHSTKKPFFTLSHMQEILRYILICVWVQEKHMSEDKCRTFSLVFNKKHYLNVFLFFLLLPVIKDFSYKGHFRCLVTL